MRVGMEVGERGLGGHGRLTAINLEEGVVWPWSLG